MEVVEGERTGQRRLHIERALAATTPGHKHVAASLRTHQKTIKINQQKSRGSDDKLAEFRHENNDLRTSCVQKVIPMISFCWVVLVEIAQFFRVSKLSTVKPRVRT